MSSIMAMRDFLFTCMASVDGWWLNNPKICEYNPLYYDINDLSWSTHITNITSKALSVKAFLQRNLKSCPTQIKLKCYNAMIRPIHDKTCLVPSHKKRH